MGRFIGLDIGSRTAKGVLIDNDAMHTAITDTGFFMQKTADDLVQTLLEKAHLSLPQINYIVSTGYGRISLEFKDTPHREVTEISCHARGAHYLNPGTKTIIDIGGQDSKAIKVDPSNGKVLDFVLNDKCAAGTGKFLEMIALSLGVKIEEMGDIALQATNPSHITSQCVVFAESEVISLKAMGETQENIASGIHFAVARRVSNLLNRVGIEPDIVFTGGVSKNKGMKSALERTLKFRFTDLDMDAQYAGALGAAVFAQEFADEQPVKSKVVKAATSSILNRLEERVKKQQEALIASAHNGTKVAGYFCIYTPVEIIDASGAVPVRLFKGGDDTVAASGEIHTRSYFCQFCQSCVGGFRENDPLYRSVDKIYTFNTCDQMKKTAEAIEEFYNVPTQLFCLPRERTRKTSGSFFQSEVEGFKDDLEKLTGKKISEESLSRQIILRNKARALLKKISDLRKKPDPPIKGSEFLELVKAYYYLPAGELLQYYENIYEQFSAVPGNDEKRIRLMMSGGIVADGDRRLIKLIEDEIGARVVVEDHCTGLRPFYSLVEENGNPIKSLSSSYLNQSPCARMKPLEERVRFSEDLAKEYDVDGILYVTLKFCSCYGISKNTFQNHFLKLGIPVLEIPTDYSQSDIGQLKTKIGAFLEVLGEK
jgi:predicted CoA-substrate-specific enzyme activase